MSEIELLPCPFCGGRPEVIEFTEDDGFENRGASAIECQGCLASSHVEFGFKENLISSWNRRAALSSAAVAEREPVAWPEPKVTNPDIANPTGVPYLDCLIHRLLDAQQDINLAANEYMDQSLCDASVLMEEVERSIRLCAAPPTSELEAENTRLKARLAEALKALEPFALVAEHDISEDETDSDAFRPMPKPFNHAPQITVGHLRAASRALEDGGRHD